ncbi:MAG: hypothetical protein RIS70_425, partial [Planctomycetota bacterium]
MCKLATATSNENAKMKFRRDAREAKKVKAKQTLTQTTTPSHPHRMSEPALNQLHDLLLGHAS